jgi:diguanylate cyclase (GGDEF)-like protein/PAS domain S-box-containing protein
VTDPPAPREVPDGEAQVGVPTSDARPDGSSTLARHIGRLAAVFDATPIGVGIWSTQGELVYANPVLGDLLEAPPGGLVGASLWAFLVEERSSGVDRLLAELLAGARNAFECDLRGRRPDGAPLWMRAQVTAVYGPGRRPAYLLSQVFHFTDTRLARAADRLGEDAPVMLWLTDEHGIPRVGNRESYAFLGEPPVGGDLSRGLFDHLHPEDLRTGLEVLTARLEARESIEFVARSRRHDGAWRWLRHIARPRFGPAGEFQGYVGVTLDVTEVEALRRELAETTRLFRTITDAGPVAVARLDSRGRITYVNARWAELLDDPRLRLLGTRWHRLLPPDQLREVLERGLASVETGEPFTLRVRTDSLTGMLADGPAGGQSGRFWAELQVVPVRDADGRPDGWVATLTDVTAEIDAGSRADRLARVLDAGSDFLMIAERNGVISYVNNAARRALGVRGTDEGAAPRYLMDVLEPESDRLFHEVVEPALATDGIWRGELTFRAADGTDVPVSAVFLAHAGESGRIESISAVARDITDLKAAQSQMLHAATHDYLTGLPNRLLLYDRLEQALARYRRYGQPVALLFLDLDRFKPVNDEMGHQVGDAVLVEVADRIHEVVRETDTAARVGGDEFAVLVEGIGDLDALRTIASRLRDSISAPVRLPGVTAQVGVSVGLVVVDDDSADVDALMALADAAMYRAKASGRGEIVTWPEHTEPTP